MLSTQAPLLLAPPPSSSCCGGDGMSVVSSDGTASTTPSSSSRSSTTSESPEDAMASHTNYNESWPAPTNHAQHSAQPQWREDSVPRIVQQPPLIHRPQPSRITRATKLPEFPRQEPLQVKVPFLVNYDDNLAYGPQKLPTVLELEEEDMESLSDSEEEDPFTNDDMLQEADDEDDEDSRSDYSEEPACMRYSYVDCYHDHRWDLARGDEVLSEAIYYHVLEATPPTVPPLPVETPELGNLVRPQAMRVLCPTTIAPVFRDDDDDQDNHDPSKDNGFNWYRSYLEGPQGDFSSTGMEQRTTCYPDDRGAELEIGLR